ncbi:hypothetical protein G6F26_009387 [Rhizopus arrhizus]|nr:hypothetical protein G6F22_003222 [Rhizopus arrhizus]KAG1411924.1 hypothetical protein G6F58_008292 [Rhizopus delemar]KAG0806730.1 hypothetical protein G6F20_010900 [Rhizopus arrhizus]KAG0879908.1 hypothetical protein G6F15_009061 [Rhizopus arrhizus]KAG0935699.1 hypothetical protein G6F30_009193 [Rhizopus arrhizus]
MDDIPSAFVDENTPLIHRDQAEERQETLKDLKGHIKPLLSALYMIVVAGLNDGTLGSIIPRVKQYYDIPNETVSLLFLCSSIGFFTSALMNGFIVHRIGQLNTIYMGSCLQLLSYLILMMGFPFPVMAAAMVCTGLGTGITDAAMNVFVASLPMATLMLNILHAVYGVGAMISPLVATFLLEHNLPWKGMYIFLTIASVINVVGVIIGFMGVQLEEEESADQDVDSKQSRKELTKAAILHPMTIIGSLYILIYVGDEVVMGGWGYTYLTEGRHGDPISMGRVISTYWAGLASGRILLGYLAGKFGEKLMITIFTAMIVGCLSIMIISADIVVNSSALISIGLLLGPMFPTTISIASKVLPRSYHTTSLGFISALGAGGAAFFPFITGIISGKFGILSMPYACAVMTVGMIILWAMVPSDKPFFAYFHKKK